MKTYVKPALTAFSLFGNETLCSGCDDVKLKDMGLDYWGLALQVDPKTDGIEGYTSGDFANLFQASESCAQSAGAAGAMYCKFTSTNVIIITS